MMGFATQPVVTQHKERRIEIEVSSGRVYLEVYAEHIDGGSTILEMTFKQARNLRDQVNVALSVVGED